MLHDECGECSDRGLLKQRTYRQLDIEVFVDARDQLDGENGFAAELKKRVVNANPRSAQNVTPNACQHLFGRAAWSNEFFFSPGAFAFRIGQGTSINFSVDRQRQLS